jgi:nitrite reductase/ring-hydroxylating ferredoxin subunit
LLEQQATSPGQGAGDSTMPSLLCAQDDIAPGTSRGFALGESSCFVVKNLDGEIYIYVNSCPHLGVELEWVADQFLDSEGQLIQCSTHGALFTIESGECVTGPCLGQSLRAIPFSIERGNIMIEYDPD